MKLHYKLPNCRKHCFSFIVFVVIQSHIAFILTGSALMPSSLMMNPRYSVSFLWNSHFEGLIFMPDFCIASRIFLTSCWCPHRVSEYMSISSKQTMQQISMYSIRTSLIYRWNAPGALHNPKGMPMYSYAPSFVKNVVFHSSPSWIRMLW